MDRKTLNFYQSHSQEWAAALPQDWGPELDAFLQRLPAGARILELGCGDGRDTARMIELGFDVHPSDGSPEMARMAGEKLGRKVPVMQFQELSETQAYDAAWCHACLLHADRADLPKIIGRIHRALKPGGWHFANFKGDVDGSDTGHRDKFGRYYNYMSETALRKVYSVVPWQGLELEMLTAGSYGEGPIPWIRVLAQR
jgi:SAM-dependent methyltransferase